MRIAVLTGIAAAVVAVFALHPWSTHARSTADPEELTVTRASLRPGEIVLSVRNDTHAAVRLAQIIVDDAYVDFQGPAEAIGAGRVARLTIDYPWVMGEAYSIDLLMSSGAIVEYELPGAES